MKYVLRWIRALDVEDVLIENVPDFMTWGPLHRKCTCGAGPDIKKKHAKGCLYSTPIKSRKGEYFYRFIQKLRDFGYNVEHRILTAADYGDPTTRQRLFIIARKNKPVIFPEPTHHRAGGDMFGKKNRWRPAREIIDWSIKGESIYNRKQPLAENTMRRIIAGLQKFGGKAFVIGQQSGAAPRSVDDPVPTIAAAGKIAFVEPFILTTNWQSTNRSPARSVDEPLPTVIGNDSIGVVQPFIIPFFGERDGQSPRTHSIDEPLPAVTSQGAGGLVEPFIIPVNHGKGDTRSHSLENPMPTITSVDAWALIDPYLVEYHGGEASHRRTRSVDDPMPTLDTSNRFGLAEPFLVEYYGTGGASSVDEPMKTITAKERFGLVEPFVLEHGGRRYLLDIRFRMLQPHELAAAMSFPKSYKFNGTREKVVKQIGNSVPVKLAEALCATLLQ